MELNTQLVDGKQKLDEQERALNFIEQATFAKVISYAKLSGNHAPGITANQAVLQNVPIGQQPNPLHLETLDIGANATSIINQQMSAGRTIVFQENAFVGGKEQVVLG